MNYYLKLDLNCRALIIYLVFAVWLYFFSLSNLKPAPINPLWKINYPNGEKQNVDTFDTYIVKSDNDMDRTNFWPVFE